MEISRQASLISLTLPGTTYPICLAFALINALAKQQTSKPSTGKVKCGNRQTSISDQFDTPWSYIGSEQEMKETMSSYLSGTWCFPWEKTTDSAMGGEMGVRAGKRKPSKQL